jgi:PIN domain nuclease of toxin-antitoxin system
MPCVSLQRKPIKIQEDCSDVETLLRELNLDAYESEPAIVETGVTPILHYDPLDRLIRTRSEEHRVGK